MMGWPLYNYNYIHEVGDSVYKPGPLAPLSERIIDSLNMSRTREEIMNQGGFDNALYNGVRENKINKDEFTALQMYQAETERLRQKFLQDGQLSDEEKRILQQRQDDLTRLYRKYVDGDYHPKYDLGGRDAQANYRNYYYDKQVYDQYSKLYDGIRSGEITRREYLVTDNNLEAIQRYRGAVGEFQRLFDPDSRYQHSVLRNALSFNNTLIDYYNNNWERTWPSIFINYPY